MSKFVLNFRCLLFSCTALAYLSCASSPLYGETATVELTSPKSDDHFEVNQPLFFWTSTPTALKYEIYIDDAKVGEVPPALSPVMHFGATQSLAVGPHHWSVKAIPATGDAVTSVTSAFTIDLPGNWPPWAIGTFQRYGKNPLLSPQGNTWEAHDTFNPGVVFDQGKYRMLYRAQGKGSPSQEGYAESVDGVTFTRNPQPVIGAPAPFRKGEIGIEDARLFLLNNTYYAFYTAQPVVPDNSPTASATPSAAPKTKLGGFCLFESTSSNCTDWKQVGMAARGTKNGALICDPKGTPVKINGKFAMFVGNSGLGIVYSDDLITWTPIQKFPHQLPPGWVGPWEPCVAVTDYSKTQPDKVVLFIAGTLNGKGKWYYAISEMLYSKADLTKRVDMLDDCIMKPQEAYESGQSKNCLWTNCIIQNEGQWLLYYGAGDSIVALATAPVK